jgi:hypothetical protein
VSDRHAQEDWVGRVLGVDLTNAGGLSQSAQRGLEAKASNVRGIAYPKLLLRWRAAQATVSASLDEISKDILSRKEVIEDLRFAQVKKCAARLPTLVPTFGSALEDAIDAGINEGRGPRAGELAGKAITIVDAYRQQIAAAVALKQLEAFATGDLAKNVPLGGELDAALSELRAELTIQM